MPKLTQRFVQFLVSSALAATVLVNGLTVVPPSDKGTWDIPGDYGILNDTLTDSGIIANTAAVVDQKAGAYGTPDQPVPSTIVTAVDGQLTAVRYSEHSRREAPYAHVHSRRAPSEYQLVFNGTGIGARARDAAIEGTAYLTFTLVNNATYSVNDCLQFCDTVEQCVFANLYYEFNNDALDHREASNLKCAVYADIHSDTEKTNWGGQQLEAPPSGLTYIQHSSGWSSKSLVEPTPPEGYDLTYGPADGANEAPGYMGFVFLDRYDVDACAQECNKRGADQRGGACQYFNIWRAIVDGVPTTYTCSLYYIPTDKSTAINHDQGHLTVTWARGYTRKNFVVDGGFEGFNNCDDFCFSSSYANWVGTSSNGGINDASIFHYSPYSHFGSSVGLLGSAAGLDDLPGTLTPSSPLQTEPGKTYVINFFHASAFSGGKLEADAFVEVRWNGEVVSTVRPGYSNWKFYSVTVTSKGSDVLAFHGGKAPAWSFIDDITVFLA